MIPQNCKIFASIIFYVIIKIICYFAEVYRGMMRQSALTCIPETAAEQELDRKWVPKKKHEVLKAKYKCLKKLFQIYDASVIGMLPDPNPEIVDEAKPNRRRKRSHRTKTDACAGTTEISNGDITNSEYENSVANSIIRNLNLDQSCISTQVDEKIDKYSETNNSKEDFNEKGSTVIQSENFIHPHCHMPCYRESRKLTRLQCFVQRLFGIRREAYWPNEQTYAESDCLTHRERRKRRGMRFRRIRRPKKVKSETALKDVMRSPAILSYVQSVQRSCLMDTTPRQCPVIGCNMKSYGILNYNDHLNICHLKDRKYVCHYCHEGFEKDNDRLAHENEHIGISKLQINNSNLSPARRSRRIASNTQTDPEVIIPEDKLKKIVSFFDKISDPDQIISDINKDRSSESNLLKTDADATSDGSAKTRRNSCCNMRKVEKYSDSETTSKQYRCPVTCHICGENFHYRRQLSLHVDLAHSSHDKFSKFHSSPAFRHCPNDMISEDGQIKIQSNPSNFVFFSHPKLTGVNVAGAVYSSHSNLNTTSSTITEATGVSGSRGSTTENIVYLTQTAKKPSMVDALVKRLRNYKWEPGTKIIRV